MNTDAILDFIVEYHIWFIVGFAIIALAIIGFIANKMKWLPKKEKNKELEADADMIAFYDDNANENNVKIEAKEEVSPKVEEISAPEVQMPKIENISETQLPKVESALEEVITSQDSNIGVEIPKEEINPYFDFEQKDFEKNAYDEEVEDLNKSDEQEVREIEEEISESNIWIEHDEELTDEITNNNANEVEQVIAPVYDSTIANENVTSTYEQPTIVPYYGESEMITPVYDDDDELSKRPDICGELEVLDEIKEEKTQVENPEIKNEVEEEKIEVETTENEQTLPEISLPEFSMPSSLSFTTVDEDIDKLSKMQFGDNNTLDVDTKQTTNNLDDTMQISYSQLKAMVEDILAESDKEKEVETKEKIIDLPKEDEDSNVEITEDKQQDDEDDVWKF